MAASAKQSSSPAAATAIPGAGSRPRRTAGFRRPQRPLDLGRRWAEVPPAPATCSRVPCARHGHQQRAHRRRRFRRPPGPGVGPEGPHVSGDHAGHRGLAGGWPELPLHRRVVGRGSHPREPCGARENSRAGLFLGWRPKWIWPLCGVGAQGEPGHVSTSRGYRCDRGDCAVLPDLTDPDSDQRIDRKQGAHQVFGQVPEPDPHLFGPIRRHCGSPGAGS